MGSSGQRPLALWQAESAGDKRKSESTQRHKRACKKSKVREDARLKWANQAKPTRPVRVKHVVLERTHSSEEVERTWHHKFATLWDGGGEDTKDVSKMRQLQTEPFSHEVPFTLSSLSPS